MANRIYQDLKTQGVQHVQYNITLIGAGAAAPTLGEGDPAGATAGNTVGSYITTARSGVGAYSITTVDPFLAIVGWDVAVAAAVTTTAWSVTLGVPSQNADYTWTMAFQVFSGAQVATEVASTGRLYVSITARNSLVLP